MLHDPNAAPLSPAPQPAMPRISRTGKLRSAARVRGRAWASGIFDQVMEDSDKSNAWIAARLEIDESIVADMRHGSTGLQLGDLREMGSVGKAILRAALAAMEAEAPAEPRMERIALRVGSLAGDLGDLQDSVLRATADGQIDEGERRSINVHVDDIEEAIHQAKRAVGGGL